MFGLCMFVIGLLAVMSGVDAAQYTESGVQLLHSFIVMFLGLLTMYFGVRLIEGK